ncbi:MAG: sigma-70 family RNA polymerase sigma factor [Nitrospira defluvii]|nr:sigma-70 family RNA polymerase sigma factor [Nitrospira defluvii]
MKKAGPEWQDILQQLLAQESSFRTFVRRRLADEALAEDVLQQSLMRAVEHQHALPKTENVVGWFYRILRHAIVDTYRSRAADARKTDALWKELVAAGEDQTPALDELRPTVCACLYRLLPNIRPAYAELLRRIDLQGESPAAVAQDLRVTPNNLTVRLHRARQALRASLEQSCGLCTKHGCLNCTC